MSNQITQHLSTIMDAVRKIEDLLGMTSNTVQVTISVPNTTTTQIPVVPPVAPAAQTAPVVNSTPVPSGVIVDSLQTAISKWESNFPLGSTVMSWIGAGMPNFIDKVDPSSSDAAVGAASAFISYMLHQGITLSAIKAAAKPGTTPAQVYQAVNQGHSEQAFSVLSGVIKALGHVASDDPFSMRQAANRLRPISHV